MKDRQAARQDKMIMPRKRLGLMAVPFEVANRRHWSGRIPGDLPEGRSNGDEILPVAFALVKVP